MAGGDHARRGTPGHLGVAEHEFRVQRSRRNAPPLRLFSWRISTLDPLCSQALPGNVLGGRECPRRSPAAGGDFVSFHARYVDRLIEPLRRINPPLGKYAVLGNHDLLGDDEYIVRRLAEAGVRTLVNENVRLATPHADVWVCGLDDWDEGEPDAEKAFRGADGTRILCAQRTPCSSCRIGRSTLPSLAMFMVAST